GISLDIDHLEKRLNTKVALISARKNEGIDHLKNLITNYKNLSVAPCLDAALIDKEYFTNLQQAFPNQLVYKLWLVITQDVNFGKIDRNEIDAIADFKIKSKADLKRLQQRETIKRYQFINDVLKNGQTIDASKAKDLLARL